MSQANVGCEWCATMSGCDCEDRRTCANAGTVGHRYCGMKLCGCPKFACTCPKTYGGVEFCDLSSKDKELVNQGIIEADELEP